MNRRQRRAAGIRRRSVAELEHELACPDCASEVTIVAEAAPGRYNAEVRHDDTCPWFVDFKRSGGLGVRISCDRSFSN